MKSSSIKILQEACRVVGWDAPPLSGDPQVWAAAALGAVLRGTPAQGEAAKAKIRVAVDAAIGAAIRAAEVGDRVKCIQYLREISLLQFTSEAVSVRDSVAIRVDSYEISPTVVTIKEGGSAEAEAPIPQEPQSLEEKIAETEAQIARLTAGDYSSMPPWFEPRKVQSVLKGLKAELIQYRRKLGGKQEGA